jgi:geranylgeranyl pyrophosphate synthase
VKKKKIMVQVLDLLQEKSKGALEKAKKGILNEKIESRRARKALEYYVENWDDTTHPGILALTCEAVGGSIKKAEPMQIVMLYLTAAMDLHDDLIDQSEVKGGKFTVFGKYGKDITLLLGNAMMVKGFALLCDSSVGLPPNTLEVVSRIIKEDFFELGNANLLEIELKGKLDVSPKHYLEILEKKASSISVHAKIGAIVGNGSSDEIMALAKYGRNLGILIAIREEFVDIFETDELKCRMKNEILPLPLLYTFKNPQTRSKILDIISKQKLSKEGALEIVEYVFQNGNIKELRRYIKDTAAIALENIAIIKGTAKENLVLPISGALEDI